MQSLRVTLEIEHLARLKKLQTNDEKIEYNGEISIDEQTGKVLKITERRGQFVEPCNKGCHINWHTHPQDYSKYFPDHPSSQDMKYVLFAVSKTRELVAHLVFTPCFVYALTLTPTLMEMDPANFEGKAAEIDALFNDVSNRHSDRATEAFRNAWMQGLRDMGFSVDRFKGYTTPITLTLRRIDRNAIRNMEADKRKVAANPRPMPQPSTFEKFVVFFLVCVLTRWAIR